MAQPERGVEIATGRRQTDGHMRLALFTRDLLALTVEGYGERATTLLLTRRQATELQRGLASLIPLLTETPEETPTSDATWSGKERRQTGELREK